MSPFELGALARKNGAACGSCPAPLGSPDREHWLDGWRSQSSEPVDEADYQLTLYGLPGLPAHEPLPIAGAPAQSQAIPRRRK